MGIWYGIRERYWREFGHLPGEDPEPPDNESEDSEELDEEGCEAVQPGR